MSMKFTLQHKDPATKARAGELTTDHGVIRTPIFMPVGTAATVKGIFHRARRGGKCKLWLTTQRPIFVVPVSSKATPASKTPVLGIMK